MRRQKRIVAGVLLAGGLLLRLGVGVMHQREICGPVDHAHRVVSHGLQVSSGTSGLPVHDAGHCSICQQLMKPLLRLSTPTVLVVPPVCPTLLAIAEPAQLPTQIDHTGKSPRSPPVHSLV